MLSTYLDYFSGSFGISLVFWPLASLILTLPILALIYNRYHRLRLTAAMAAYLTVLYLLALVFFTLWPMPDDRAAFCATHHLSPQLNPLQFLTDLSTGGRMAMLQILLNVAFFLPLGFIMGRVFRWRFILALPVALLVSLFIETAQLTGVFGIVGCAYRLFDVDDLIWNTSGAIIGYLVAMAANKLVPTRQADAAQLVTNPGFIHRAVSLALDLLLATILSMSLGMGVTYAVHRLGTYQLDGHYRFGGLLIATSALDVFGTVVDLVMLLIFELLIPLPRRGRTLGATFTHMTIETKQRHGWSRFFFYLFRTAIILAVFGPWTGNVQIATRILALLLLVFYLIKRQMPYDLLPGTAYREEDTGAEESPDDRRG